MLHEPEDTPDTGQLEGRYANYFQIGHNAFEFVFDFGQRSAEYTSAQLYTRIITVPFFAKVLFKLLRESITQYEQTFGIIPEEDEAE